MGKKQKARSTAGLTPAAQTNVDRNPSQGLNGTPMIEAIPNFQKAKGEKVFKNKSNAWIVLGRDRQAGVETGYGGPGADKCGSIDLVVGRMAGFPAGADEKKYVDMSFQGDAARVYISQRADIDTYLNLVDGGVGNSQNRSAIAIKADSLRLVARQGIKIVASMDEPVSTLLDPGHKSKYGIDLLSGNYDEAGFLQPIPKGDYLRQALISIVTAIEDNTKLINNFMSAQIGLNTQIASHVHVPGIPIIPLSVSLLGYYGSTFLPKYLVNGKIPASWTSRVNISKLKLTYLRPGGARYINSKLNRTT